MTQIKMNSLSAARSKSAPQTHFHFALGILMLSGIAALGHEVLWTRRMIDLLGASSESSARVFECFFLGLSLGALTISVLLPRVGKPWRVLGAVELGVALLCLPVLKLSEWTDWIWPSLGPGGLASWQGEALKTVLSVLVMLPPTVLMGMTLPLATAAVLNGRAAPSNREIFLYAANTSGGVFGLGLVVLWLLQWFGAAWAMLLMMTINLMVASACFWRANRSNQDLWTGSSEGIVARPASAGRADARRPWLLLLLLAFFSGAGVLSLEVLGLAMANLAAPVAIYPQAGILICVILLLAIGAWLVPRLMHRFGNVERLLPICLAASGLAISLVPILFMSMPDVRGGTFGYGEGFHQFLWRLTRQSFFVLGPAVLLAGTVFPLLVCWDRGEMPRARRLGLMLAVNGLGGIIGAEVSYRLLLPLFAAHVSIGIVATCYALAAIGLLLGLNIRSKVQYVFPIASLIIICHLLSARLVDLPVYFASNLFKVVDMAAGREGSLIVAEDSKKNRDMILDNSYTLGGSAATATMRREAHLPLLFHPSPQRVAFIGLGTGITSSGALEHKAVKSITAVELSGLVAQAAERDFGRFNHNICHDPRAVIHIEDARIYLEAAPAQFDVIIGDLFTPWRPGEAALCSLEQFRAARQALRHSGVFCQWIELTQWTPEQFQTAAATFKKVFGHLYLIHTQFKGDKIPLGLLGFRDGGFDWNTVRQRCDFEAVEGQLVDPVCRHVEGVAMLYLGQYAGDDSGSERINTLANLSIELSASKQLVAGNPECYYGGDSDAWMRLVMDQLRSVRLRKELPEPLAIYPEVGLLAFKCEWSAEAADPIAARLAREFQDRIPASVIKDTHSDWSLWPCSYLPWNLSKAEARD